MVLNEVGLQNRYRWCVIHDGYVAAWPLISELRCIFRHGFSFDTSDPDYHGRAYICDENHDVIFKTVNVLGWPDFFYPHKPGCCRAVKISIVNEFLKDKEHNKYEKGNGRKTL